MKPVTSFTDALRALGELKRLSLIEDYAIAGAMALVFWTEPIPTYDLDVLVFLPPQDGPIVSLATLYAWAEARGYPVEAEHVMVEGVPVQFLPAHNELADEAIATAATLEYETVVVRVVRPEYLIALYLEPGARTVKRRERAAALIEAPGTDQILLADLLRRFRLEL
jgi:hypothetical protein